MIFHDGSILSSRSLLSFAFPFLTSVLKEREEEEDELLLILPGFHVNQIKETIDDFLRGKVEMEVKEEMSNDLEERFDEIEECSHDCSDNNDHNLFEEMTDKIDPKEEASQEGVEVKISMNDVHTSKKGTDSHIQIDIPVGTFICPYCRDIFPFDSSLRRHINCKHRDLKRKEEETS